MFYTCTLQCWAYICCPNWDRDIFGGLGDSTPLSGPKTTWHLYYAYHRTALTGIGCRLSTMDTTLSFEESCLLRAPAFAACN